MLGSNVSNEIDFAADADLVEYRSERVNASATLHPGEAGWNRKVRHGA
jgi:hypothetical protein